MWIAGSWRAPISNHAGSPHDRGLLLLGVERVYPLLRWSWGGIETDPAILPLVATTGNAKGVSVPCGGTTLSLCTEVHGYSAFGVGLIPLALRLRVALAPRVDLRIGVDGGGVLLSKAIPVPAGARFNFLADALASVAVRVTDGIALTAGYRYNHLSNGGRAESNPGIDSHLAALGIAWAGSR